MAFSPGSTVKSFRLSATFSSVGDDAFSATVRNNSSGDGAASSGSTSASSSGLSVMKILSWIFPFRAPHAVLLLAQLLASINGVLTQDALADQEVELSPLTLAVARCLFALLVMTIVRIFINWDRKEEALSDDHGIVRRKIELAEDRVYRRAWKRKQQQKKEEAERLNSVAAPAAQGDNVPDAAESQRRQQQQQQLENIVLDQTATMSPDFIMIDVLRSAEEEEEEGGEEMEDRRGGVRQQQQNEETLEQQLTSLPLIAVNDLARVLLLGFCVVCFHNLSSSYGLYQSDAATFSLAMSTIPIWTFIIGCAADLDAFSVTKTLAVVFVVLGNAAVARLDLYVLTSELPGPGYQYTTAVFAGPKNNQTRAAYHFGVFLSFASAFLFACYLVFQRPIVSLKMSLHDFLFVLYIAGSVSLLFAAMIPRHSIVLQQLTSGQLSMKSWAAILYAGCVDATLTFALLGYATKQVGGSLIAALANGLQPLLGIMIRSIISSNTTPSMDGVQTLGASLIGYGLWCCVVATLPTQ